MLFAAIAPTDPIYVWLTQTGAVGILAFAVFAFMRGLIVPGSMHRSALRLLREERDRAMDQVYKQAEIAQRALEALERRQGG